MIKEEYYVVGNAYESDEYYFDSTCDGWGHFTSKKSAEKAIYKNLKEWGYAEGCKRSDYDIAKITIIIERG